MMIVFRGHISGVLHMEQLTDKPFQGQFGRLLQSSFEIQRLKCLDGFWGLPAAHGLPDLQCFLCVPPSLF